MSEEIAIVGKKFTIVIPKKIRIKMNMVEGQKLAVKAEQGRIILEPIPDPFELALKGPKFAKTTFEEFEQESEEMQSELLR